MSCWPARRRYSSGCRRPGRSRLTSSSPSPRWRAASPRMSCGQNSHKSGRTREAVYPEARAARGAAAGGVFHLSLVGRVGGGACGRGGAGALAEPPRRLRGVWPGGAGAVPGGAHRAVGRDVKRRDRAQRLDRLKEWCVARRPVAAATAFNPIRLMAAERDELVGWMWPCRKRLLPPCIWSWISGIICVSRHRLCSMMKLSSRGGGGLRCGGQPLVG